VDFDRVVESNLNRQLIALHSTVGRPKALVCAERLSDINPACRVTPLEAYFCEEDAGRFALGSFDHVVDCIDTMKPKTYLIKSCRELGVPIVVSAGAARKTDPTGVRVMDLFAVSGCALSRKLRKRLRPLGVTGPIPVATSPAQSVEQLAAEEPEEEGQRKPIGSISYVPTVFGCVLAGWVVRSLLGDPLPLYTGKK
jgi:tRNA A37 threonylcarbamoyladenosine dehydratase